MSKLDIKPISFRPDPDLRQELSSRARAAGVPLSDLIRGLLNRALGMPEREGRSALDGGAVDTIGLSVSEVLNAVTVLAVRQEKLGYAILLNLMGDEASEADLDKWMRTKVPAMPVSLSEDAGSEASS